MLRTTHIKIQNNPKAVKDFKHAWWSNDLVQKTFVKYSYAEKGEIYGDYNPNHRLAFHKPSMLEVRGIENKDKGDLEVISYVNKGRMFLFTSPLTILAIALIAAALIHDTWQSFPIALLLIFIAYVYVSFQTSSRKKRLHHLIKEVATETNANNVYDS